MWTDSPLFLFEVDKRVTIKLERTGGINVYRQMPEKRFVVAVYEVVYYKKLNKWDKEPTQLTQGFYFDALQAQIIAETFSNNAPDLNAEVMPYYYVGRNPEFYPHDYIDSTYRFDTWEEAMAYFKSGQVV